MAKKTNKTAHVLNLISQPKIDENQIENNTENSMTMTKNLTSHSLASEEKEDTLSQQIKQNLTDFVENAILESTENSSVQINESEDFSQPKDMSVSTPIEIPPSVVNPSEPMQEPVSESITTDELIPESSKNNTDSVPPDSDSNNISSSMETKMTLTSTTPIHNEEVTMNEPIGYTSLNIPEYLVQNEVLHFLKKFDTCSCNRCVADVTALALNNLTPKYIVVDNSSISPLLSFFSSKLKSSITFELSKACMTVKSNPKH